MALAIYYKNTLDAYVAATNGTDVTNPITTTHDGKEGDVKSVTLYLRNDDITKYYSNIEITPKDLVDANPYGDVGYNETGWGVKLNKGGSEPTDAEWDALLWGEAITMDDIGASGAGDSTTYYPVWYRITCPPNTPAQNKTDVVLRVEFTENTV